VSRNPPKQGIIPKMVEAGGFEPPSLNGKPQF
jgi:hypothetical protein